MSDTFDHMCDAYDQYVAMGEDGECFDTPDSRTLHTTNHMAYHRKMYFHQIKCETEKAYLFHFLCMKYPVWVPKGLCRKLDRENQSVFVWKNAEGVVTNQTKSVVEGWKHNKEAKVNKEPTPKFDEAEEMHCKGRLEVFIDSFNPSHGLNAIDCDLGLQVAHDGRLWLCINGVAFIRFKPKNKC